MFSFLLYCIIGVLAGLAAGMFGVGGGTIIVPALIISFAAHGVPTEIVVHAAVGTSLAAIVFGLGSSAYAHWRRDLVSWSLFSSLAPGMLLGVLGGSVLAAFVPGSALRVAVAVLLFLVGLRMLSNWQPSGHRRAYGRTGNFVVANTIGVVCAFTGVGGGGMTVPFLNWCGVRMLRAIATSAACGVVISIAGALGYVWSGRVWSGWSVHDGSDWLYLGYVNVPAAVCIAFCSAVAAPVGAGVVRRIDERSLRIGFGCFLIFGSMITVL